MVYRVVLPFLAALALIMGTSHSITPSQRIRSTTSGMQQRHFQKQKQERHLQEFCGQCTWSGNIVCEARAQFLVKNDPSITAIDQARNAILQECISDGSEEVQLPLDAFCDECQWSNANFNCKARAEFLVAQYMLSMEKAMESLLEKRECVDPNYKPPNKAQSEENTDDGGGLSIGAIVGIIVVVTAMLMGGIIFWAWRRERNRNRDKPSEVSIPMGSTSADGGAIFKDYNQQLAENTLKNSIPLGDVVQIVNNANNSASNNNNPKNSAMKKSKSKNKKSISFAMDRPDAPGEVHCDASEYKYEDGLKSAKDVDGNEIADVVNKKPASAKKISWNDSPAEPEGGSPVKEAVQDPGGTDNIMVKEDDATTPLKNPDFVECGSSSDPLEADAAAGNANEEGEAVLNKNSEESAEMKSRDEDAAKIKDTPVDP